MARVTGIGGIFFRARDPEALNRWYAEHLGVIELESTSYEDPGWFQDRGETLLVACDDASSTPGPPGTASKLNFRVDDLDGMVARLRERGTAVEPHAEDYPNGRFAELADPEGNAIELWEPNAASLARDPGPPGAEIVVTGHLRLRTEDRDAFVADTVDWVRTARAAEGCLDFVVAADPIEADRVNVLERWASPAALRAFRGDGVDDESAARILEVAVHDYRAERV